ncbi:VOC family protein [Fortiea sp. LEGE XX443]|uniref:VOC family protein n=1 Tax=Fortiea sp. LEGE XX443 TaxID=1828611 RepID=UPI00188032AB|nr:VOC family protein [Fortiea sp. LEGE XX443]MBE9006917.1 VOC family protein [Fortiea sp. LEGE XX443]
MIDHVAINVSNFEHSKNFYKVALAPLGYKLCKEYDITSPVSKYAAGFGTDGKADFWIVDEQVNIPRIHVAFTTESCEQVNTFHTASLTVGGTDNGAPSLRSHYYHSKYYGAFVLDPDGHNIEVVCYALSS